MRLQLAAVSIGMIGIASANPPQAGITPFAARYQAEWRNINVGTSDLELTVGDDPAHYLYTWKITAHGIFHMMYRDDLIQKSWFELRDEHVQPLKYTAVDGASTAELEFDWDAGRAHGTTEKKSVDLKLKEGTQDVMSIQVEVMIDLKHGHLPKIFQIVDRDTVKEFIYQQEGTARISTALGPLDTVVVSSSHTGSNRVLKMWFAPSLGYVPVQAERARDGKLEFAMRIKSLSLR